MQISPPCCEKSLVQIFVQKILIPTSKNETVNKTECCISAVFSLASARTSPPNPECRGMNTAAKHLETGIKSLTMWAGQGSAKCNPTKHCSGNLAEVQHYFFFNLYLYKLPYNTSKCFELQGPVVQGSIKDGAY